METFSATPTMAHAIVLQMLSEESVTAASLVTGLFLIVNLANVILEALKPKFVIRNHQLVSAKRTFTDKRVTFARKALSISKKSTPMDAQSASALDVLRGVPAPHYTEQR